MKRGVRVDVDHRRHPAVVGGEKARIDAEHPFLELPETPHRDVVVDPAVAALDRDRLGQVEHGPDVAHPGTCAHDDVIALDRPFVGEHGRYRAAVVAELEPRDLHALENANAVVERLS
jgi:hypothetical protein